MEIKLLSTIRAIQIALLVLSILSNSSAQTKLTEIDLGTPKIRNVQPFALGDSIMLSIDIYDLRARSYLKNILLIDSAGGFTTIKNGFLEGIQFFGVHRYNNLLCAYFLTGKWYNSELNLWTFDGARQETKGLGFKLEGVLIGAWQNDYLRIAVFNKVLNTITVYRINHSEVQLEYKFKLPVILGDLYKEITFLPENNALSLASSSSRLKLFKVTDQLILTFDRTKHEGYPKSTTLIFYMDLTTGLLTAKSYDKPGLDYYRSYVYNNSLYQLSVTKNALEIYIDDLKTEKLNQHKTIEGDSILEKIFVYKRVGADNRISNSKEPLDNMIRTSMTSSPFIIPRKDSCDTSLIIGTYNNESAGGGTFGSLSNPIAGLLTFALTTTFNQLAQPPGISRYFNMDLNCNGIWDYGNPDPIQALIHEYEISLDIQRSFFDCKGYCSYQDGIIGIYQGHRETSDLLTVVLYTSNK